MKYIIWGSGKRGKWVLHFLGEENVIAFVDSNKDSGSYLGKPVMTFEQVKRDYSDCLLVITPLEGSRSIEKQLTTAGFSTYMKLDDCPMTVPCDEQEDYSFFLSYDRSKRYGLVGINIFSLWLYGDMKKNGTDVYMAVPHGLDKELYDLLCPEVEFIDGDSLRECADIIIESENYPNEDGDNSKYIRADDFIIQSMSYTSEQVLSYKNIHSGKRCFIVATGPSLKVEDLDRLYQNNEICISTNRIFNIFDRTQWRPDYYMIGDREMIEDMTDDIAKMDLKHKFVSTVPGKYWDNSYSKGSIPYKILLRSFVDSMPSFSPNVEKGVCQGTTITYLCLQLAVYMGFKEIYLLGVDFNYSSNIYDPKNHFEGCDTPENKIRLNPVLYPERTLLAYERAKKYCDEHGIKVWNATRGGKLEVFDRVDFNRLFKK